MSEATHQAIGRWCWPELAANDIESAKNFYGSLLGWEAFDVPTAMGFYTIFRIGGQDCAAAYAMSAEQLERGLPVQWRNYVKVASADAAAENVKRLGGSVVAGPFDVEGIGRMASLKDPMGVGFAVWQDGSHHGTAVQGAPGAHCWTERMTRDPGATKAFFTGLFGWTAKDKDDFGFTYTEFYLGAAPVGGMMPMAGPEWEGVPDHFMQYFLVENCDAGADRATELGAKVCVPPCDIPTVGRFAILDDPQGATFAILQPAAM
jgi:predicted enzyme related to lactoylglutathione lyase